MNLDWPCPLPKILIDGTVNLVLFKTAKSGAILSQYFSNQNNPTNDCSSFRPKSVWETMFLQLFELYLTHTIFLMPTVAPSNQRNS